MKQLNDYIIEKFKISSKTVKKYQDKEIEIKIGTKTSFNEKEIEEIKEFSKSLEIIPDIITNYNDIQPKNDRTGHSYNSAMIELGYFRDLENTTPNYHENNIIRIKKLNNSYFVRFVSIDEYDTYLYPEDSTKYFNTIKECFDCIKEKWKELKFSEVINKYK